MAQLADFAGVLQVDGYAAYVSLAGDAKTSGKIRLAYCLVHARRNFVKVHKATNSPFAREVIERIGAVYAIEERIRGLDAGERRAARQVETKPLMEALKARLVAVKDGISRRSTLIKAIDYMLERWEGLTAFLDNGRLRAGHQHGGAFDPADCNRKKEFAVQRRRRRGRDLGYSFFAS